MRHKIQLISLVLFLALSPLAMAKSVVGPTADNLTPLQDRVRHALVTLP